MVQNNYPLALDYFQKAIRKGEQINDQLTTGISYGNIGVIYSEMKNYDMALKHFEGGLAIHNKINYNIGIATGLGNIGNGNERLMAGLAFEAHTRDTRPITTYWLDVLESGYVANNQYVLATKFGGFDVPNGYTPCVTSGACATPPTIPTTTTGDLTWDKDGNGKPDNYFEANNPLAMQTGLTKAFSDILSKLSGSSNTFAVINPSVVSGSVSFATSYKADNWTGDVTANTVTFDAAENPVETLAWKVAAKLNTQASGNGWNTNRKIATATCTVDVAFGTQSCVGQPFRAANIGSLLPSFSGATPDNLVNYLRGDATNAGASGKAVFRARDSLLGDIVNSKVVAVGPPRAPYTEALNPGYEAFKLANASRATVAYVGANDGMLHAFNGGSTGGNELFAYVPNAVMNGPTNTPLVNGIAHLANPSYDHKFYVDATPVVEDVDFGGGDWRSILVGGLGKGGKSYYALDVTNPAAITSEATLGSKVLWEFTHNKMGYGYDMPLVVKTKKYGWAVILTSGYNNSDGKGYFFLVNPKTGKLFEDPIPTGEGSSTSDAGLAHVNAFVADARDSLTDAAYAGDLLGNVWRLDLSGIGAIPAPTKIAAFGDKQPITVAPIIEIDKGTLRRFVFIGTGRLLADSDIASTVQQSFYAILDGTQAAPYTSANLPANGSYPVSRAQMIDNTETIKDGIVADASKPMGYYIDLGASGTSPYRVNIDMISSAGVVAFVANSVGGDACTPSGKNKLFAISYGSGKSVITLSGQTLESFGGEGLATSLSFFRKDGATTSRINISNDLGESKNVIVDPSAGTSFTMLNWREVPASD